MKSDTAYCNGEKWCRRRESNPRPRDYETLALPLSYAGLKQFFMLRIRVRKCQGVVSGAHSKASDRGGPTRGVTGTLSLNLKVCNDLHLVVQPCSFRLSGSRTRRASPICLSTPVLLTGTASKSILLRIEHCPTYRIGESLSKRW